MIKKSAVDRPVLIYDNKCSPCWKYAKIVNKLSKGRIRLLGHYEVIDDLAKIKDLVFPTGYDPTSMSWFINENGAYGGRAWILPLTKEIIGGFLFGSGVNRTGFEVKFEEKNNIFACSNSVGWFRRASLFLRSTNRFTFSKE